MTVRRWFIIHFVVDLLAALPLIFAPRWFLESLGFVGESMLSARLLGAALFAIGTFSFLMRNADQAAYRLFLSFKILWSAVAIIALLISLFSGTPAITWLILLIFVIFFSVWVRHKKSLK